MAKIKLNLGDSVVVKPNTEDPDWNIGIGGWQGRISEINEEDNLICVQWDSITLNQMPGETIDQSEEEGLDWTEYYLYPEDVDLASPRDSKRDVKKTIRLLANEHKWSFLGEEGKRIQAVLAKTDDNNEWAAFEAWERHFQQVLIFPFEAEVTEWQERGPLDTGDKVTVLAIESVEDRYGVLVSLRHKREGYVFPLCDLDAIDQSSPNYQPIRDYSVWFANH